MRAASVGLTVALLLAACGDSGPSGPGALQATMDSGGVPVGAVVLTVNGVGVTGFSSQGTTRVFANRLAEDLHRLVVVSGTPGSASFLINVEDLGATFPAITVLEGVTGDNLDIADVTGIGVAVSR